MASLGVPPGRNGRDKHGGNDKKEKPALKSGIPWRLKLKPHVIINCDVLLFLVGFF